MHCIFITKVKAFQRAVFLGSSILVDVTKFRFEVGGAVLRGGLGLQSDIFRGTLKKVSNCTLVLGSFLNGLSELLVSRSSPVRDAKGPSRSWDIITEVDTDVLTVKKRAIVTGRFILLDLR